ncbi:MAG: tyrosine--tRNA ligase [Parcubacteria group bacterium 21-54-25]|nr:MAG: tyrosine--tRNA ligase [Parcubacteria group bacterium 21-54-25]HQU07805.1 tyrosine--tRNA ligase [Candidatus Paceibacterota bacterium]
MELAQELEARGLVADKTAALPEIFSKTRTVYLGIDPTADSAQIGNLAVVLLMKRLGMAGHKLIFLVGGATGMIGDPKEKGERALLDEKTVRANARALKKQLQGLLGKTRFRVVDNTTWLSKVPLVPFLRDIGKHFTVNELIKRDTIRRRLETPDESISYTEFTYTLLQGYDYLVLHQTYGCDLQIGASDQWTNILSGVELIRRKLGGEAHGLTAPLVTDATGKKFGKSEGNAVWLDPKKTSPFVFYQFWLNQPDAELDTYLKFYTFLSLEEIETLMTLHAQNPGDRVAQMKLAWEVTTLVHGEAAAKTAAEASKALFGGTPLASLSGAARAVVLREAPTHSVGAGTTLTDVLAESGLASSKGEARRLIEGKGVSLNGVLAEIDQLVSVDDFSHGLALLKKGRRDLLVLILK